MFYAELKGSPKSLSSIRSILGSERARESCQRETLSLARQGMALEELAECLTRSLANSPFWRARRDRPALAPLPIGSAGSRSAGDFLAQERRRWANEVSPSRFEISQQAVSQRDRREIEQLSAVGGFRSTDIRVRPRHEPLSKPKLSLFLFRITLTLLLGVDLGTLIHALPIF